MRLSVPLSLTALLVAFPLSAENSSSGGTRGVPPTGPVARAPLGAEPAFVAATWGDDAVHFLDSSLANLSSFPSGLLEPNGITFDGTLIYVGTFDTDEVIAYDLSGVEQFRWSDAGLGGLQGLTIVGSELAVMDASADLIRFYVPATGAPIRSFSSGPDGSGIEGLTYDGTYLWALGDDNVYAMDPADGSIERTIPNAAVDCDFTGSGLAVGGPDQLVLACRSGDWYRVSALDGSVQSSGNNGLEMLGLEALTAGAPQSDTLAIPTLGSWGIAALAAALAAFACLRLVRRRTA